MKHFLWTQLVWNIFGGFLLKIVFLTYFCFIFLTMEDIYIYIPLTNKMHKLDLRL